MTYLYARYISAAAIPTIAGPGEASAWYFFYFPLLESPDIFQIENAQARSS